MKYTNEQLIKERLIARIPASKEKAKESIVSAQSWLSEAEKNLSNNAPKSCLLSSYLSMFHSARAILFKDGFREKSHFAVARYLENTYCSTNKLEKEYIELLDHYRDLRHQDQYRTTFVVSETEVKEAIRIAKDFVKRMSLLV